MKFMWSRLRSGSWRRPRKADAGARHQESAIAERIRAPGNLSHGMFYRHARTDYAVRRSHRRPPVDSHRPREGEKGIAVRRHHRSRVSYTFFAQLPHEGSDSSPRRRALGGELRFESRAISRWSAR